MRLLGAQFVAVVGASCAAQRNAARAAKADADASSRLVHFYDLKLSVKVLTIAQMLLIDFDFDLILI